MADTRLPLAKLSRPRLYDPIARHRLFRLLDEARKHPVLWIVGPPGAGKTTLSATYLQTRGLGNGIWYQVDAGDNDPPSFFYHLRLAERGLSRASRRAPLPLLTAEYLADVPTFCRRFMRTLFARMPAGAMLVFDNFQDLAEENPLQSALAHCLSEIPGHVNVAMLSRSAPPAAFAQGLANGSIARIDWDDLRMTLEETQALVAARVGSSHVDAIALHRETGGWAAGLTLLIEKLRHGKQTFDKAPVEENVFDYFASQLFERASAQDKQILMRLSLVPHFTSEIASRFSGDDSAERLLESLYKRNLFTDRRRNQRGEHVYQFHALFRAFLRHRVQLMLGPQTLTLAKRAAANVMENAGQVGDAAQLYVETQDWGEAIRLTLAEAPGLLSQGRRQVLLDRIARIPDEQVIAQPWMLYWQGAAQMEVDPAGARPTLQAAYARARDMGERHCVLQSAAAITQTHILEYSHLAPLDDWLPVLEQAIRDPAVFPSADAELAVIAALLIAISYRQPAHAYRARCLARVYELVMAPGDANLRMIAVGFVLAHACTTGHLDDGLRAIAIANDLVCRADVTAINAGWWFAASTWYYTLAGDFASARQAMKEIVRIGRDNELPVVSRFAMTMGIWTEIFEGRLRIAEQMVHDAPPPTNATYDVATLAGAAHLIATLDGRPDSNLEKGQLAVRLFDEMGSRMHRVNFRMLCIWSNLQLGQFLAARSLIAEARAIESDRENYWQKPLLWALEAEIYRALGDEAGRKAAVTASMAAARQGDYWYGFVYPFNFRALCCYALESDIDTDYVRHIVRRLGWRSPSQLTLNWPWKVLISTLGEFRILRDDEPVRFGRKAPRRLLAVLKAIIAFGGRDVAAERLADALWPDVEGHAAAGSLSVALRRLRELLGGDFVGEIDGKVSLDDGAVWLDAWAFEAACATATESSSAAAALKLYKGAFLAEETDARWAVQPRARLRAKFIQLVGGEAARLEAGEDWNVAAELYRRGLDADDLAESFYQGLMRCQSRLGQRADALSTYRRMQQVLSVVLGVAPSQESTSLYLTISTQ